MNDSPNPFSKESFDHLTEPARRILAGYLQLGFPTNTSKVITPYYNNRRHEIHGGLRALSGKGTPNEIIEEAELFAIREKIKLQDLSAEQLSKFLIDHRLGIDCSGLVYHILAAEALERGKGDLSRKISFQHRSLLRRVIARLRPAENVNVTCLATENNSHEVRLRDVRAGDFLAIIYKDYSHVILVSDVVRHEETGELRSLLYVHSIAWPEEGLYQHGVRTGAIEITDLAKPITEQIWTEKNKSGKENPTQRSLADAESISLRRLNLLS